MVETSVEENNFVPKEFMLYQNYPNPFNPETLIKFTVPKKSFVSLIVYDILGKEVARLINEELIPGEYNVEFNAASLSTGIYIYRLITDNNIFKKKMLFIK